MFISLLILASFLLGIISITLGLTIGGAAKNAPGRMFQILMWLLVIASVVTVGLSGRSLRLVDNALAIESTGDMSGFIGGKVLLVVAIGFAIALATALMLMPWWRKKPENRYSVNQKIPPKDIIGAFLVYYIAFSILPFAFAKDHYFHVSLVYPFFIFLALLLWLQYSKVDPVVAVKQTLVVLVAGSLVAAAVQPSLALQPGYSGLVPGFNQRLLGLTATANTMGSVALALLLIEVCEPFARRWLHYGVILGAGAAMVLSQSKTSVGAALVGLAIVTLWRWVESIKAKDLRLSGKGELAVVLAVLSVTALLVASFWLAMAEPALFGSLERKLSARALGDLSTATGRFDIWKFAINSGLESPIFGQGGNFWGIETRLRTGLTGASHAHNQFLQVFTRSGAIGLLSYLVFFGLLLVYTWRARGPSRGGSLAFFAIFFIRSVFEVPLQPNSVLGGEFFAFVVFLVYVVDRGAKPKRAVAEPSRIGELRVLKFG